MAEPSSTRTIFRRGLRGIRPRLIGVLLVPTIAALAFGALRMQVAVAESADAARAETIAVALPDSFRLAVQLTTERDAASAGLEPAQLRQVRTQTDAAVEAWLGNLSAIDYSGNAALREDLVAISRDLERLPQLRKQLADPLTRPDAQIEYTGTLNLLLGLSRQLPALEDESLYEQADALAEVRAASEALGIERRVVGEALVAGAIGSEELGELTRAQGVWTAASARFFERTSSAARDGFDEITDGTTAEGGTGAPLQAAVDRLLDEGKLKALGLTLAEWQGISFEFIQRMEEVIVRAATDLADGVSASRATAERTAIISAVLIFLVLFAALGAAMLAARSILRPLGRLREAALDIAQHQLPDRVRSIEEADGPVDVTVMPLEIGSNDEIGEVADAFEAVHAEAVRLAGEQAQMRANVNRMFVNLSRRSKNLVERQLRLIDELEANEQDPDDLANLFRLDHLATRLRRNDESLLVLAGGDTGQSVRGNVLALDVLRAAGSEIEQFARVEVRTDETRRVRGRVAGDLVHLLAELIENATNFSPPDTTVVVRTVARSADGPLTIEIHDHGVGMTPEELAQANAKLRRTDGLDADVARMMGLVVTARLAHRHGLAVELTGNTPRGVVARVHLPAAVLSDSAADPAPRNAAPGSAPAPTPTVPIQVPVAPVAPVTPATPAQPASPEATVRTWFAKVGTDRKGASSLGTGANASVPAPSRRPATSSSSAGWPSVAPSALDLPAAGLDDVDDSPIFASLQSEWFTRRTPLSARSRPASDTDAGRGRSGWTSPADEGWRQAAEVNARSAQQATTTVAGLPKRVPGQHLVPGAAPATPARPAAAVRRSVDPRQPRGLASFQQGVNRARGTDPPRTDDDREEGPE